MRQSMSLWRRRHERLDFAVPGGGKHSTRIDNRRLHVELLEQRTLLSASPGTADFTPLDETGPLHPVGTELANLFRAYEEAGGEFDPSTTDLPVRNGRVSLGILTAGQSQDFVQALEAIGMEVAEAVGYTVGGIIPISSLDELAAIPGINTAWPAFSYQVLADMNGGSVRGPQRPSERPDRPVDDTPPEDPAPDDGPREIPKRGQSDRARRSASAITTGGATVPMYLYTAQSGPLINLDDFGGDPRFTAVDGSGFAAAIIDTGMDRDHSYFGPATDGVSDRIVYQYDFADGDDNVEAVDGHGTNVTSIIASENGTYPGMAPGVDIIHLKVFEDSTGDTSSAYIQSALQWVENNYQTYNIASVNMSLGDGGNYNTYQSLYGLDDELEALADAGVIVVSASGNDFFEDDSVQGVAYPAADAYSLSIGAVYDADIGRREYGDPPGDPYHAEANTTAADRISAFSQRDDELTTAMAPGDAITGAGLDNGTLTLPGTSQAAPHVAGMAVLAQDLAAEELGRWLTVGEFTHLLQTTGTTVNDGDDEDDNVTNTDLDFPRVDMFALAEGILNQPQINAPDLVIDAGNDAADGNADTFSVYMDGSDLCVWVNGYVIAQHDVDTIDSLTIDGSTDTDTVSVWSLGPSVDISITINNGGGGADVAALYDSSGNDVFTAEKGDATLEIAGGYGVQVNDFVEVHAYATAGGADTAYLYDTSGADTLYATADGAQQNGAMWGTGYYHRAKYFEAVYGYAANGGSDTVDFTGSSANETMVGWKEGGQLTTGSYFFQAVSGFEDVDVNAVSSGYDTAAFYDSTGDDILSASVASANIHINGSYHTEAFGYDRTDGYATAGGTDAAYLYGPSGNDFFYATMETGNEHGAVWGTGYYNRAKYFEVFRGYFGNGGGDEEGELYDSSGDDLLEAEDDWVRLSNSTLGWSFYFWGLNSGDQVDATRSTGTDTKDLAATDFTLTHNWP